MFKPSDRMAAVAANATLTSASFHRAARFLLPNLEHGLLIGTKILRSVMESAFGVTGAAGSWDRKTAYHLCEAATVLFLCKYGAAITDKAGSPIATLPILSKIAGLLPIPTDRPEESQALVQFSAPIARELAVCASTLGMERKLVTLLSRFRKGAPIRPAESILFTTYATLRTDERREKLSRVRRIAQWLGATFDGVIAFDRSHAMQNTVGGPASKWTDYVARQIMLRIRDCGLSHRRSTAPQDHNPFARRRVA
ncbi:strawberry notch family protein [Bradyrhizobium sp. UFLA05-112]